MVEPSSMRGSTLSLVDEITVGRSSECHVTLADDPFVSTTHARFFRSGDKLFIEDLGSTNGTSVNSERIVTKKRLQVDDRVQIGRAVFELQSG